MRVLTVFLLLCGLSWSLAAQETAVSHARWGQAQDAPPPAVGTAAPAYSSNTYSSAAATADEPSYQRPTIRYGSHVDYQPRISYGSNLRYWPNTRHRRSYATNNGIAYGQSLPFHEQHRRRLTRRLETEATYGDKIQYGHHRRYGLGK
ncbi:MAG: hypothetical protein GC160_21080 [Acidobacteria bacterium]|nr:hypothetical protein [Acidobacteriota bacterium]